MVATALPQPEAAGPIAGAPGHFAHHDWLTASVKSLDQLAGNRGIMVQHGPANAQSPATNTYILMSLITCFVKSPGCPPYTIGGANNGVLTLGDDWPTGLYRLDWGVGFAVPGSPTYGNSCRTSQILVNGAVPTSTPNIVNITAPSGSRPAIALGVGSALLKPLDTVSVNLRQDSGGALDTSINACFLQLTFVTPAALAVTP